MYSPINIAKYFLLRGREEGIPISLIKLQKLLYFAHGWHLAMFDKPLLSEKVQAWKYGPIIPSLYELYIRFGNEPINTEGLTLNGFRPGEKLINFLDFVWEVYKNYSPTELSTLTHVGESPWEKAIADNEGLAGLNQPIDDELIKDYFRREYLEDSPADSAKLF